MNSASASSRKLSPPPSGGGRASLKKRDLFCVLASSPLLMFGPYFIK